MSKMHCSYNLEEKTVERIEKCYRESGCRSKSDFIDKAVGFYCGYLTAENYRDYFPDVIVSTLKASLDSMENRMGSLLFKMAVELAMLENVMAATYDIDESLLQRLRGMCVQDVKAINGRISFEDAVRYQSGDD